MKSPKPVKAWAVWSEDLRFCIEVSVDGKPSMTGTDDNGCVYPRHGKLVRVEIRPLVRKKARRQA